MATITKATYSATGQIALFTFDNGDVQGMATGMSISPKDVLTPEIIVDDIKSGKLSAFLSMFDSDPEDLTNQTIAANSDWIVIYEADAA